MGTSNPQTVLVVDDDPEIRRLVSLYLARMGFIVTTAADGRSAIRMLDESRPALLCLDLMLPESSGYDVCEHVRRTPALHGLPIVMLSARSMPADRAQAEELGVSKYIVKPFTQAQFVQGVRETLERSGTPEAAP